MKIGIYTRSFQNTEQLAFAQKLVNLLNSRNIESLVYKPVLEEHPELGKNAFDSHDLHPESLDYLLSLGGDGTMLDTLTIVRNNRIPVLGINMGRFGFLASSQQEDIENTINELENKTYFIDQRSVIKLESDRQVFDDFPYALNDFVIHKKDSSSMITVHSYMNGVFLNSYWSDGLICSTPTGSSGYSLSCGGPLLFPGSGSFVITPIAPHNLNVRPAVVSDDSVLSFEIEGRDNSFLATLDSRSVTIQKGTQLAVKKADFRFCMVRLQDESYMDTIRKKLMWGLDNRN
ncbi:MAG: NAD kinase [Bacteroidetes bacterium]|nr:NAD kinase [Bacteroidota bacterium]